MYRSPCSKDPSCFEAHLKYFSHHAFHQEEEITAAENAVDKVRALIG